MRSEGVRRGELEGAGPRTCPLKLSGRKKEGALELALGEQRCRHFLRSMLDMSNWFLVALSRENVIVCCSKVPWAMTDLILETDTILAEIVRRLVEAYEPERIYLFGSRARGSSGEESDYDLLVIVPDNAPPERQDSDLAYRALRGTGVAADVLVWTRSRFERRRHVAASLPATVLREGRLVHVS